MQDYGIKQVDLCNKKYFFLNIVYKCLCAKVVICNKSTNIHIKIDTTLAIRRHIAS